MFIKKQKYIEKKLILNNLSAKIKYETKYLSQYLSFTKELTDKKNKQLEEQMYEDSQTDPESEHILQDLYIKEKDALLSYYHHSAIVLVYTIFESIMSDICNEVQNFTSSNFTHNCLSGNNIIANSKKYLQLTTDLQFSLIEGDWAKIGKYQKLRNIIVHQNSFFTGDEQKNRLKNDFKSIVISNDEKRFHILEDNLVHDFIALVNQFVQKIISHLESVTFLVEQKNIELEDDFIPF